MKKLATGLIGIIGVLGLLSCLTGCGTFGGYEAVGTDAYGHTIYQAVPNQSAVNEQLNKELEKWQYQNYESTDPDNLPHNEWYYTDKTGKVFAINPEPGHTDFNFSEGLAPAVINHKYGFINKAGKVVIEPKFENTMFIGFSEGLAAVEMNGKWGYINKVGKMVIPPKFVEPGEFYRGSALVIINEKKYVQKKWDRINKSGEIIVTPQ